MSTRVTLREIAQRAKVHISTVSLALRDSPKLRPEMRARIQKIAASLGYTPDPAMAALVAHRKGVRTSSYQSTLAWLDNWPMTDRARNIDTFAEYFAGAEERAARFGYKLEEFRLRAPGITPARMAAILRARNIQGIISPPQQLDGTKLEFDFTGFSAVALGYSLRPASLHVVTNHQFLSATQLVAKLRSLGYRRIALYLARDWDDKVNHGYSTGFTTTLADLPASDRLLPCFFGQLARDSFHEWVRRDRPEAVITQGISESLVEWLGDIGLRVPDDIAVADLSAHPAKPHISGIYQHDRLIGATAVDVLIGLLQRNERGLPPTIIYTLVDGVWQQGSTVRDIR